MLTPTITYSNTQWLLIFSSRPLTSFTRFILSPSLSLSAYGHTLYSQLQLSDAGRTFNLQCFVLFPSPIHPRIPILSFFVSLVEIRFRTPHSRANLVRFASLAASWIPLSWNELLRFLSRSTTARIFLLLNSFGFRKN